MENLRTYDENALVKRLERLDRSAKTAFAAACAQRLVPLFERYSRVIAEPTQGLRLTDILSTVWDAASGRVVDDLRQMENEAESLVPSEEQEWVLEAGYAESAAAAVAYAARAFLKNDAQESAWAARQLYDVGDYAYWQANPMADFNDRGPEADVLKSNFVQAALTALDHDLQVAESSPSSWLELRHRSEQEGRIWTATLP